MKARVKATGEIVGINPTLIDDYYFVDDKGIYYSIEQIELTRESIKPIKKISDPDYWTRLEHQYAGMAMNALLLTNNIRNGDLEGMRECNTNAMAIAYALVEKYKKEEEK